MSNTRILFTPLDGSCREIRADLELANKKNSFINLGISPHVERILNDDSLYLKPILGSTRVLNGEDTCFASIQRKDTKNGNICARNSLNSALNRLKRLTGCELKISMEMELLLFSRVEYSINSSSSNHSISTGHKSRENLHPKNLQSDVSFRQLYRPNFDIRCMQIIEEISHEMLNLGFIFNKIHAEEALGQHEFCSSPNDAVTACEMTYYFKLLSKSIAKKFDMEASFMPQAFNDKIGTGLHLNLSLWDGLQNKLFNEDGSKLSELGRRFVSGIQYNLSGLMHITNPYPNGFKRLHKLFLHNRKLPALGVSKSNLVRIHFDKEYNRSRIELRFPDFTPNIFISITAILCAAIDGITNEREEIFQMDNLPQSTIESCTLDNSKYEFLQFDQIFNAQMLYLLREQTIRNFREINSIITSADFVQCFDC